MMPASTVSPALVSYHVQAQITLGHVRKMMKNIGTLSKAGMLQDGS